MPDLGQPAARLLDRQFKMLGGDAVRKRRHALHRINRDDGAVILPGPGGDGGALERLQRGCDGRLDGIGEIGIIGNQNRLRGLVMLGL